jgi:hypothetical protein
MLRDFKGGKSGIHLTVDAICPLDQKPDTIPDYPPGRTKPQAL